jgi:G patch domain-containing protein 1
MAPKPPKAGEVYDAQGRRRFHGAWTGGFSAGYYNTVGSAEGWTPANFVSGRGRGRGGDQQGDQPPAGEQRREDFMDEEDGVAGGGLKARAEFDYFGTQDAMKSRPREGAASIIGPVPHEFIEASINDPVGRKLLRAMGWRESKKKFK